MAPPVPARKRKTQTLSPPYAVWKVWAMTGSSSDDPQSQAAAHRAWDEVSAIRTDTQAGSDPQEQKYVRNSLAAMEATLRSLEIIHKGREVNFKENERLKNAYLDSYMRYIDFGKSFEDRLKGLPGLTVGAASGMTVGDLLGLSPLMIFALTLMLSTIGYLINTWIVISINRKKQFLFVREDFEKSMYYDLYLTQASLILKSLYRDLETIHYAVFGDYFLDPRDARKYHSFDSSHPADVADGIVEDIIRGIRSSPCCHVQAHMERNLITPERWPFCECGKPQSKADCAHWES